MNSDDEVLVPVFMPALSVVLLSAEDKKGAPLSFDEVISIRDASPCIMMRVDHAQKMAASHGYEDIAPENCWYDWQLLRRELGRKPDLDPGPKFDQVRSSDPEYQQTIQAARESLDQFRAMLPADGSTRAIALVKSEIVDGNNRAFIWLFNTRMIGPDFVAEFFEIPADFKHCAVGDSRVVTPESLLDWMVNDDGVLHGGFSIRYHRAKLSESERAAYDAHIGVTKYA